MRRPFTTAKPRRPGRGRRSLSGRVPAGPVSAARLSDASVSDIDPDQRAWPGESIVLDGCRVHVRRTPGAAGAEPAVYVHGLGGDATNWTDLAGLLAPWLSGRAIDLLGFGNSGPSPDRKYTLSAHARCVVRLIEAVGDGPVHLFGNSLGGVVCVLVAARRPDLVRTLTLVSPAMPDLRIRTTGPTVPLMLLSIPGTRWIGLRQLSRMRPEDLVRRVLASCFGNPSIVPEHRLAEAIAFAKEYHALPWAGQAFIATLRGLVWSYLAVGGRSLWRLARRITAPTLVVWGDADQLVDVALAPRAARAIPGARLLVLPGVGHVAQMEDSVSVARAFLALREDNDEPVSARGDRAGQRRCGD